jgi:hypothetical protein
MGSRGGSRLGSRGCFGGSVRSRVGLRMCLGSGSQEWYRGMVSGNGSPGLVSGSGFGDVFRVLRVLSFSRRPPGCIPKETTDAIRLYSGDHRIAIDLSLCMSEWKYLVEDGAQMEGTFLDVVLRHVAFRADHDIRCQYHFTHNWISRNL